MRPKHEYFVELLQPCCPTQGGSACPGEGREAVLRVGVVGRGHDEPGDLQPLQPPPGQVRVHVAGVKHRPGRGALQVLCLVCIEYFFSACVAFVCVSMFGTFHQGFWLLTPLAPTLRALSYASLVFGTFPFYKDKKYSCSVKGNVKDINQM